MPPIWPPNEPVPPADDSQKEAANSFRQHGRIIIEASPGTGKTFLGVYLALCSFRLGWTSSEYPALFLTFSRNARVQIEQSLQIFRKQGWMKADEEKAFKVYNYHAFFLELIQQKAGIWGCKDKLKPASIQEHKDKLGSLLSQEQQLDRNVWSQANLVYALKRFQVGDLLDRDARLQLDQNVMEKLHLEASTALRNGRPYYDDFAALFLNLLELCPELSHWLRLKYPVMILDEFQDTDIVQWRIIEKINPIHPVVLYDRYQMIYEWRGARQDRLDQAKCHLNIQIEQEQKLTENHRCGDQASFVQFIQELRTDELVGNRIDGNRNHSWLSKYNIQPIRGGPPIPNENRSLSWLRFNSRIIDFHETTAILTHTNYLANHLYKNLRVRPDRGNHLICRWIGGEDNPDERIRDWIWHLRSVGTDSELRSWLGNLLNALLPESILRSLDISFANEFMSSKDQVFARRKKKIFQEIKASWLPIWDLIVLGNFRSLSVGLNYVLSTANKLILDNGYLDPDLIYYLKQLSQAVEKFQSDDREDVWQGFCDYLENSHLRASFLKMRNPSSGLYILTIHQSKGREFDHVIIPWLSGKGEPNMTKDGRRFPSKLDYTKLEDRKLLYVAFTRAKRHVTIIYPQDDPSPFLPNWKLIP